MNTDADYQIGHEHEVCQDYAVAGRLSDESAYAIVSDGCSSSDDVDFGARLLALSAREELGMIIDVPGITYRSFGSRSIAAAGRVLDKNFNILSSRCLDATLLVVHVNPSRVSTVFMYGDGAFVHVAAATGRTRVVHVRYTSADPDLSAAPYYLSYNLNADRMAMYEATRNSPKMIQEAIQEAGKDWQWIDEKVLYATPVQSQFNAHPGDVLAVISDGIDSFKSGDGTPIQYLDLIKEFCGYKQTQGVFVKRRLAAFQRRCHKEQISHSDDISIAAIVV